LTYAEVIHKARSLVRDAEYALDQIEEYEVTDENGGRYEEAVRNLQSCLRLLNRWTRDGY